MEDFKDLRVWTEAHERHCLYTNKHTHSRKEMYGLTSQLRRASSSSARTLRKRVVGDQIPR